MLATHRIGRYDFVIKPASDGRYALYVESGDSWASLGVYPSKEDARTAARKAGE